MNGHIPLREAEGNVRRPYLFEFLMLAFGAVGVVLLHTVLKYGIILWQVTTQG